MECNIKYQEDGELLPVLMFFLKQLRRKPIRYFLYVLCFEGTVITFTQFYYILKLFNLKDFLQYITPGVVCFFGVTTTALLLAGYNTFLQKVNDFKFNFYWNIENISNKTKKAIVKECKTFQISSVMRLILSLSSAISWTVFWHQNENKLLLWPLVVSRYPEFAWPFRISIDVFFVVAVGVTSLLASFRSHHKWMHDNIGTLFVWLALLYLLLTCTLILWIVAENNPLWMILLVLITICILSFEFTTDGQRFSNTSEKLSTAVYSMKWYCWNNRNQQIYKMFNLNSNRIMEIWIKTFTPINYAWLAQFYKAVYSVANLLIRH